MIARWEGMILDDDDDYDDDNNDEQYGSSRASRSPELSLQRLPRAAIFRGIRSE